MDFEAQCQQGKRIQPQEIIEFPCIMVDAQNFQIIDTFHQYVKVILTYNIVTYIVKLRVRVRVRVKVKVKSLKSKLDPEVGSVMGWPTTTTHPPTHH